VSAAFRADVAARLHGDPSERHPPLATEDIGIVPQVIRLELEQVTGGISSACAESAARFLGAAPKSNGLVPGALATSEAHARG